MYTDPYCLAFSLVGFPKAMARARQSNNAKLKKVNFENTAPLLTTQWLAFGTGYEVVNVTEAPDPLL